MRLILALVLLNPLIVQSGQIYKCVVNGETTFSQRPCADDAELISIKPHPIANKDAAGRVEKLNDALDEVSASNRLSDLQKEERALIKEIERYDRMRDRDLKSLQAKKFRAKNNLAGAEWEQSISQEMQSVNMKYSSKIEVVKSKLEIVSNQIRSLQQKGVH